MARRQKPPGPRKADLRAEDMHAALRRLKRRLAELRAVTVEDIQEPGDLKLQALEQKVNSTLSDIFGPDTIEYQQFGGICFDRAPIDRFRPTPLHEVRQDYRRGVEAAISSIEAVVSLFEEKLEGPEDPSTRARRTFAGLDLHPELARAVIGLFENGHFSNAVEDACKVLDGLVKLRSGRHGLSGTELMQAVFSPRNPVLKFNALQTDTDRSEQQGLMFLYAGAMLALRNPRAHALLEDEAETALEYIAFVNLLLRMLERATPA